MSCLLCPSSHLVIAASCTRHSSLRPSVSLHAASLHHADYCVPSTALARACICSCLVPLQLVPPGSIPAGPFQRMISLASFASPHLATIVALFIALRSTSRACVRLSCPRCGSFLPVPHPSRPFQTLSCFLHSALSCFVSFILLLASHLVSIFAFFIGFPSCSRSVPRTHTRIYTKICSLKQWLFSM